MDKQNSKAEPLYQAINTSKDNQVLASRVIWAGTSEQRRKGLLGRSSLAPDEGMYIVPSGWVHTFGMKFPIDIAFLARDGRILTLHHGLKPNRLSKISIRAEGVLELASGRFKATGAEKGDIIKFKESDNNSQ